MNDASSSFIGNNSNASSFSLLFSYARYDLKDMVELYDLGNDVGETTDVSAAHPEVVELAVQYMDEAHVPGPHCGYRPPHPNSLL